MKHTILYFYFIRSGKKCSCIPSLLFTVGDILSQNPDAHKSLATLLFHSQSESVVIGLGNPWILLSWVRVSEDDDDLDLWFVYDTVKDRWTNECLEDTSMSWLTFLHFTMDRMDRFILTDWLEQTKLSSPANIVEVLSPKLSDRMKDLKRPTKLWETAFAMLTQKC